MRLLLLLDALAIALVVLDAPYFKVARVTLGGLERTDPVTVMRAARLEGRNVLLLNLAQIEQAVSRLPTVKRVSVARRLPDQVSIVVQERQPRAVWESKGARYLVDDEGVVLGPAPGNEGLLTVVEAGGRALAAGEVVDAEAVHLADRLAVVLPGEFGLETQVYQYTWPMGLTLVTSQGWRLSFGNGDDFEYKLAVLRGILQTIQQRKAHFELIDVRSKERPYFR